TVVLFGCDPVCSFFFSSRRRHTRFSRDWSSDVCSSDLATVLSRPSYPSPVSERTRTPLPSAATGTYTRVSGSTRVLNQMSRATRSEERRVGKECRFRGAAYHQDTKQPTERPISLIDTLE